jgi:hypothetical protein
MESIDWELSRDVSICPLLSHFLNKKSTRWSQKARWQSEVDMVQPDPTAELKERSSRRAMNSPSSTRAASFSWIKLRIIILFLGKALFRLSLRSGSLRGSDASASGRKTPYLRKWRFAGSRQIVGLSSDPSGRVVGLVKTNSATRIRHHVGPWRCVSYATDSAWSASPPSHMEDRPFTAQEIVVA